MRSLLVLLQIAGMFSMAGCMDFREPPSDSELDYNTVNIMPNASRFIQPNNGSSITGGWFWYRNVESRIDDVDAFVRPLNAKSGTDSLKLNQWYNEAAKLSSTIEYGNDSVAEKICFAGHLVPPSASARAYVGIGFNLCAPKPSENPLTHLTQPVGRCHSGNSTPLLEKFVGISFDLTFPDEKKVPEQSRLVVQFRERGFKVNSRQPECAVFDNTNKPDTRKSPLCNILSEDSNQRDYRIEAWHGNTKRRLSDTDSETDMERPNLTALMAIQFELLSDVETDFKLCLSDVGEIYATDSRDDIEYEEPYLGETDVDSEQPDETRCLQDITEHGHGASETLWVAAKRSNDTDADEYPDNKKFWIMKKEVTAGQFSECIDAENGCAPPREWETCSTYRYRELKAKSEDADNLDETLEKAARSAANCVSWFDADKFCKWIGGRLPTRAQWEYAAASGKHPSSEKYPWEQRAAEWDNDDAPSCDWAIITDGKGPGCGYSYLPVEGCQRPDGNTSTGVCDMIGNLWEWVEEAYWDVLDKQKIDDWYWSAADEDYVRGKDGRLEYKTIKGGGFGNWRTAGGAWDFLSISASTSMEHPMEPHEPNNVGFRCIKLDGAADPCQSQHQQDAEDGD